MQQSPQTDAYSLASVMYWAITRGTPPPATGRMIRDTHVPLAERAPPEYSRGFVTAIDRTLAVLPGRADRFDRHPAPRTGAGASHRTQAGIDAAIPVTLTGAGIWLLVTGGDAPQPAPASVAKSDSAPPPRSLPPALSEPPPAPPRP